MKIKCVIPGVSGAGKTTLARTLPENTVAIFSMESGLLSIDSGADPFPGIIRDIKTFLEDPSGRVNSFMDHVVWAFGPDVMRKPEEHLSQAHYERVCATKKAQGAPGEGRFEDAFPQVETIFIDSLTELSRMTLKHAERFEGAISSSGKKDGFAIFGELKRKMMDALIHARDSQRYNVVFVGILEFVKEGEGAFAELRGRFQMEGSSVGRELPGLFDEILPLVIYTAQDGKQYRIIRTESHPDLHGFTPKDRSGKLAAVERPDLSLIFEKIRNGQRRAISTDLPPELQ